MNKPKMGRPKLAERDKRKIHIGVRVNNAEDRIITRAAGSLNKATWVRISALKNAED